MPDLSNEKKHLSQFKYIIGVDEVGRGPWAGPVVACASIVPIDTPIPEGINDSKKLTDKKRKVFSDFLTNYIDYEIAEVSPQQIDDLNILQATFLAMKNAVEGLITKLSINQEDVFILVDGNKLPPFDTFKNAECIIKGDSISTTIACSSIIAKVYRDNLMTQYAKEFPYYGWENNSGYGTKKHQEGLSEHGICSLHRRSFKPIAKIINDSEVK